MDDFERELKAGFLEESTDLLTQAESAFLQLETKRDDPGLLNEIFRLAHNLKGTSQAVGFTQVGQLTHKAENLILKLKENEIQCTDHIVTVLLEFNDKVNEMIAGLKADFNAQFETKEMESKILAILEGKVEEQVVKEEMPEDTIAKPQVVENTSAPAMSEAALESLKELGMSVETSVAAPVVPIKVPTPAPAAVKANEGPSAKVQQVEKKASSEEETIRVAVSRIEELNNIVGELVILQTVLEQKRFTAIQDTLANKSIGQLGKLSKEIQDVAMSLRMVPLKSTFQKMSRIVRDTSKLLTKKVDLHLLGEETEIDKTVLESVNDPLVHIVRNAVDHGLETTEARIAAGKPEEGKVEIMAFHEGSCLVIQVTDDGKGINPEIIRKKAIEKKVISPNAQLSDQELVNLVFHPGFSTKEQVTEISGRGVGMDVVKTNIEKLGGEVKVLSRVGVGSSFRITLPLTLAIIEGMVVRCQKEHFVVPLQQVHEFLHPKAKDINFVTGGGVFLSMRGEVLPVFDLSVEMGVSKSCDNYENKIAIVIRQGGLPFAVMVDDILRQQQVVIKKIGKELRQIKGLMGSSILGDGKPAFIIDLLLLFKSRVRVRNTDSSAKAA